MGMYDSVRANCPSCGYSVEFQSKAGDCILANYSIQSVPCEIAISINGNKNTCKCGRELTLVLPELAIRRLQMVVV